MKPREKAFHRLLLLAFVYLVVLCFAGSVAAETKAYVTDSCEITFRRGPGTDYKIIRLLKSGEPVKVLEETQDGWSHVKLDDGSEGYVLKRMLVSEEPLSGQATKLVAQNDSLKSEVSSLRENKDQLAKENEGLKNELSQSKKEYQQLKDELGQPGQDSQNVAAVRNELKELKKQNEELQERVRKTVVGNQEDEQRHLWLLFGAGILGFGILIGALSRRSSSRFGGQRLQ